jgi:hypothetical protein
LTGNHAESVVGVSSFFYLQSLLAAGSLLSDSPRAPILIMFFKFADLASSSSTYAVYNDTRDMEEFQDSAHACRYLYLRSNYRPGMDYITSKIGWRIANRFQADRTRHFESRLPQTSQTAESHSDGDWTAARLGEERSRQD